MSHLFSFFNFFSNLLLLELSSYTLPASAAQTLLAAEARSANEKAERAQQELAEMKATMAAQYEVMAEMKAYMQLGKKRTQEEVDDDAVLTPAPTLSKLRKNADVPIPKLLKNSEIVDADA